MCPPSFTRGGAQQFGAFGADLTFITNEAGQSLLERFKVLIRETRLFDALVGYFYTSGFYALHRSLETTEKIRILVGIRTDRESARLIREVRDQGQQSLQFSHAETKEEYAREVEEEMESSGPDDKDVEEGVRKFQEWLRSGKLAIRAYPSANIHAKLYIMTFAEGDRDVGRVITGSSNFTQAGLVDNLEFNVELKNRSDYEFALAKFNQLWDVSADVTDTYEETIQKRTWLNDSLTPYELYLKFLYEYFRDELDQPEQVLQEDLPEGFLKLDYQEQAVLNARRILDEYGGVFLADVVGLGKTYMAAMLARELEGRTLVIAPPVLLDEDNPGSWRSVFSDFGIRRPKFESLGKLDRIIEDGHGQYENVIVDEAHRFRSEDAIAYEQLAQICRGKRVILVTATPYNNRPRDILALVKLFQKGRRSTIPNVPDLERFFNNLERRLRGLDRQKDFAEYIRISRDNSHQIREKVLRYLTVRRTRTEIERYFSSDLTHRGLRFPEIEAPQPVYYQLNREEDDLFTTTVTSVVKELRYARYTPLLYYTGKLEQIDRLSAVNLQMIMRILLVKRLESSFHAFRLSLGRFIRSYRLFLREFDKGNVYTSRAHINRLLEMLEQDDDEAIQRLLDEGRIVQYPAQKFRPAFRDDLESDLALLEGLLGQWKRVERDPKWLAFEELLNTSPVLRGGKLIVFTESKETAAYLSGRLGVLYPDKVLTYTGDSHVEVKRRVMDNFDARARLPRDDYRILVSTEVLSEGVNLHRSNIVINYDIPWNPTRMMQRVGRVNRVDTKFDRIHTFNFFPTAQSNDQLKLREAAQAKIEAFISLLGTDARLLTEDETVESHELFNRLNTKEAVSGEDPEAKSELKYLNQIKAIRDSEPELFARVKRLPKKARTGRSETREQPALLTFFRKGKLRKFFLTEGRSDSQELDFMAAAETLEVEPAVPRRPLEADYHELLARNRLAFEQATSEEPEATASPGGRDAATQLLRILKSNEIRRYQGYTEDGESYLKLVVRQLEEGSIPKRTARNALRAVQSELAKGVNPLRVLAQLRRHISDDLLRDVRAPSAARTAGPREVILSEYLGRA